MSDGITFRAFQDADLSRTLSTLKLALGDSAVNTRTPEWFAWKHFNNPFGRSILVVAEADGLIVGLRAFMRWELNALDGTTLRCVRAVDTATHPDFRRRGIFEELSRQALEMAREDEVDLVFNTPNAKSGAGYIKMGWAEVGKLGVMVRPTLRLITGRFRSPAHPNHEVGLAIESVDDMPADRDAVGLRTPRTTRYLNWRFGAHPTARYRRIDDGGSTAVVRLNERAGRQELVISDLFGPNPADAIGAARREAEVDYLIAAFTPSSPERRATLRSGLVPIPGVTGFRLVANPLRKLSVDITSLGNWDLSIGDLELL